MNRQQKAYNLTKIQTFDLMTGYSAELRIKVNRRWEELESKEQLRSLPTRSELAQMVIDVESENLALEAKIESDKSKVVFADSVHGSSNSILVREFAKVLSDDGFNIGQNRLFAWLRDQAFINKKNEPYQNFIEQGLFEVIERTIGSADETFTTTTTKITGKGQTYFAEKVRG
jgi:phage antirepressor YoqD-like protein